MKVELRVRPYPDELFPGEVFFVSPTLDPATRRMILKAWVPNADHRLVPGLFANVELEIAQRENALLVPESAVVFDREGTYVWRVRDEVAERVPIEIGLRKGGRVEVTLGPRPGRHDRHRRHPQGDRRPQAARGRAGAERSGARRAADADGAGIRLLRIARDLHRAARARDGDVARDRALRRDRLLRLPNRELPTIDPPIVSVTTVFPGAAPEVVETSVTDVLEDQVNGIEGVKHVTSLSREQVSQITVEFELGRDVEAAANDVRDRVARARNQLPEEIDEPIVAKRDSDAQAVMWLALSGERYDQIELTTIAENLLVDRLAKLPGVANVIIGGERRYSMRVWIDNRRLASQAAPSPTSPPRSSARTSTSRRAASSPRTRVHGAQPRRAAQRRRLRGPDHRQRRRGQAVRLRDVARVEVGPRTCASSCASTAQPAIGLGVVKQSKANTLDVADAVRAEALELRAAAPAGREARDRLRLLDLHPRVDPRRHAARSSRRRCSWCSSSTCSCAASARR